MARDLSGSQVPQCAPRICLEPAQGVNDEGEEANAEGAISAAVLGVFGASTVFAQSWRALLNYNGKAEGQVQGEDGNGGDRYFNNKTVCRVGTDYS